MAHANNEFTIIGNLTKKPEVKATKNNKNYSYFYVAVNNGKESPDFIGVVAWEKLAETVSKYCDKGDCIAVHGSISTTNRDEKTIIQLTASDVKFIYKAKAKEEPKKEFKPEADTFTAPGNDLGANDIFAPF